MDRTYDHTLAWVNAERLARSIGPPLTALPKGEPKNCWRCPVAAALGGAEVGCIIRYDDRSFAYPPYYVGEFIENFDARSYPELIAE